jgi:hypothetical protein
MKMSVFLKKITWKADKGFFSLNDALKHNDVDVTYDTWEEDDNNKEMFVLKLHEKIKRIKKCSCSCYIRR